MKALQAVQLGRGVDGARVVEVSVPVPGPGELLIRTAAVSASHLDLSVLKGAIPGVRAPRTLGIDPVGTVVGLGDGVDQARLGTTVVVKPNVFCGICAYCRGGHEADCVQQRIIGVHLDGGAADFVAVPARSAFDVPDGVSAVAAAASVHTVPVALHMLRQVLPEKGDLGGRTVLVTGAAGAVGSAAVQVVKALGGSVIAVVRGSGRDAALREVGADRVLDAQDPALADAVLAVSGGVDVVVETTGSGTLAAKAWRTLGWTGRMVTCTGSGARIQVDLGELYRNRRGLVGTAGSDAADVTDGLSMVAAGAVRPLIGRVSPLDDFAAGYAAFTDRRRSGRIVFELPG